MRPCAASRATSRSIESSAAFSPDGEWFAFTAQPSDGSGGPDVYVWRVGDAETQRLTERRHVVLRLVVRRPDRREPVHRARTVRFVRGGAGDTSAGQDGTPTSLVIDPATGSATGSTIPWRPAVDPTERWAVTFGWARWLPTVATDAGSRIRASSNCVRGRRPARQRGSTGTVVADDGRGRLRCPLGRDRRVVRGLDRRPELRAFGRLSLYRIDPATGELEQPDGSPIDVLALPASRSARAGSHGPRRRARGARAAASRSRHGPRTASERSRACPATSSSSFADPSPRCAGVSADHQGDARRHPLTRTSCSGCTDPLSFPAYRATQMVGRRVGAHRRPRPGRAAGPCRFPHVQRRAPGPRRRIPAAPRTGFRAGLGDPRSPGLTSAPVGGVRPDRRAHRRAGRPAAGRCPGSSAGRPAGSGVDVGAQATAPDAERRGDVL